MKLILKEKFARGSREKASAQVLNGQSKSNTIHNLIRTKIRGRLNIKIREVKGKMVYCCSIRELGLGFEDEDRYKV